MHKASGSDRQIIALPYLITFSTAPGLFCSCLAVLAKRYLSGNNSEASPENCTAKSYLRKIYFYRRQELQQQIYLVFKLLSGSWARRKRWGSPGIGLWEEAALSWDLDEVQVKSPSQKKSLFLFLITPAGRTGHPGATTGEQEHSRRVPLGMLHTQPQVCSREWGSAAALPHSLQLPSPSGKGAARAAAERDRNYS